jgi:hypothetical protein
MAIFGCGYWRGLGVAVLIPTLCFGGVREGLGLLGVTPDGPAKPRVSREMSEFMRVSEAYNKSFREALPLSDMKRSSDEDLATRIGRSRLVFSGDSHPDKGPKQLFFRVMDAMKKGGDYTLAIEFITPQYQPQLDKYMKGEITEKQFLDQAYNVQGWWSGDWWPLYRPILKAARKQRVPVVAVEPGLGPDKLFERDRIISQNIKKIRGRVLVLYGTMHILGKDHLQGLLNPDLVILCSDLYLFYPKIVEQFGKDFGVVKLSSQVFCVDTGRSPPKKIYGPGEEIPAPKKAVPEEEVGDAVTPA